MMRYKKEQVAYYLARRMTLQDHHHIIRKGRNYYSEHF